MLLNKLKKKITKTILRMLIYNKDAYKNYVKKDSTLKRKPKNYKD